MKKDSSYLGIVSIIAIVGIVVMVILARGPQTITLKTEEAGISGQDLSGQATIRMICASGQRYCPNLGECAESCTQQASTGEVNRHPLISVCSYGTMMCRYHNGTSIDCCTDNEVCTQTGCQQATNQTGGNQSM